MDCVAWMANKGWGVKLELGLRSITEKDDWSYAAPFRGPSRGDVRPPCGGLDLVDRLLAATGKRQETAHRQHEGRAWVPQYRRCVGWGESCAARALYDGLCWLHAFRQHRDSLMSDKGFVLGMFELTVKDMRGTNIQRRFEAAIWLASRSATKWFDAIGVEQQAALEGMEWRSWAERILVAVARWTPEELRAHDISTAMIAALNRGIGVLGGIPVGERSHGLLAFRDWLSGKSWGDIGSSHRMSQDQAKRAVWSFLLERRKYAPARSFPCVGVCPTKHGWRLLHTWAREHAAVIDPPSSSRLVA